jgi:hypothetical protein
MRWLLVVALLLAPATSNASELTAKDVRLLLAYAGMSPGTTKMLGEKGRHQLTSIKVSGSKGHFVIRIRERELQQGVKLALAAVVPPPVMTIGQEFFTISLGQLLEMISVVGSIFWSVFRLGTKIQAVEGETKSLRAGVHELKSAVAKLDTVVTEIAVTNKRLDMFDVRMDDIVKGRIRIQSDEGERPRRGRNKF